MFSANNTDLREVPLPDDDDSEISEIVLDLIYKRHETKVLELAKQLHFDMTLPNTVRRIMSHCHRQNDYFWFVSSNTAGKTFEDIENCIKQMRDLNKKNPEELMNFQALSNYIGIEYRRAYLVAQQSK